MTKKYWFYYLKNNNKIELYAYTDNSTYAKLFEEDRDMDKFICKKKSISKEEINYLAYEYQNLYLREFKFKMFDKENNKWIDSIMIVSYDEFLTVNNASIQLETEISMYCWDDYRIFKNDIIKALEILGYVDIYKNISEETIDTATTIHKIVPDTLGIFLEYFGHTMKG